MNKSDLFKACICVLFSGKVEGIGEVNLRHFSAKKIIDKIINDNLMHLKKFGITFTRETDFISLGVSTSGEMEINIMIRYKTVEFVNNAPQTVFFEIQYKAGKIKSFFSAYNYESESIEPLKRNEWDWGFYDK
jgi:hypothetical protein